MVSERKAVERVNGRTTTNIRESKNYTGRAGLFFDFRETGEIIYGQNVLHYVFFKTKTINYAYAFRRLGRDNSIYPE